MINVRDPIRVDIFTTLHLGYVGRVFGSGEDYMVNLFASHFYQKEKELSPIIGYLSTIMAQKYGLGILNPVTSEKYKYLSSQRAIAQLIRSKTGVGELSDADHLLAPSEEKRDGYKTGMKQMIPHSRVQLGISFVPTKALSYAPKNRCLYKRTRYYGNWYSIFGYRISPFIMHKLQCNPPQPFDKIIRMWHCL